MWHKIKNIFTSIGYRQTCIGKISLDIYNDSSMREVDKLLLHFGANHNYGPDSLGLDKYSVIQKNNRLSILRDMIREKEIEKLIEYRQKQRHI